MPGIWESLFGTGDKNIQQPTLNPQQQGSLQQILSQLGMMSGGMGGQGGQGGQQGAYGGAQNWLSNLFGGGQQAFSQFEAPYRQQFEQQTLPGIAERFAGANAMGGGLSSSGFGQALGGAGAQLQAQLAGLHGNLQQQGVGQAFGQYNNLANLGLGTRAFENQYQPGNTGIIGGALAGLGQGFGGALGMGLGMGAPGAISSGIGGLMNLFKNRQGGLGSAPYGSPGPQNMGR